MQDGVAGGGYAWLCCYLCCSLLPLPLTTTTAAHHQPAAVRTQLCAVTTTPDSASALPRQVAACLGAGGCCQCASGAAVHQQRYQHPLFPLPAGGYFVDPEEDTLPEVLAAAPLLLDYSTLACSSGPRD